MSEELKGLLREYYVSKLKGEQNPEASMKLREYGCLDERGNIAEKCRRQIKVVLAGGVFDVIHIGHVYTLRKAKSLGDVLVVVIARDETVRRLKGTDPIHNEAQRQELVSALRYVDVAILGDREDMMKTVELVRPDIVALGYDQAHDEGFIQSEARKRGISLKVVRLDSPYPDIKTRNIKKDPRFGGF